MDLFDCLARYTIRAPNSNFNWQDARSTKSRKSKLPVLASKLHARSVLYNAVSFGCGSAATADYPLEKGKTCGEGETILYLTFVRPLGTVNQ